MRHALLLSILFVAVAAGLFSLGFREAGRSPRVVEATVTLSGLPEGKAYRVLHMSDLHAGYPDMSISRLEEVVRQANALRPDLVVLTGDYWGGKYLTDDRHRLSLDETLKTLAGLRAPLGVYMVLGNHDSPKWVRIILKRHPELRLLVNDMARTGPFRVIGLDSIHRGTEGAHRFLKAVRDTGEPTLVLAHEPKTIRSLAGRMEGFFAQSSILSLAGHTHGGQVDLGPLNPFNWGEPCIRGLCVTDGARIFVTSGVGTSSLPVRIGVSPEIVLLMLVGDHSSGRKPGTERYRSPVS